MGIMISDDSFYALVERWRFGQADLRGEYYPLHVLRPSAWNFHTNYMYAFMQDGYELRNQFLLYLLKHRGNEAKDNFPYIVKEFLKRIT